jgi:hypothetical protein
MSTKFTKISKMSSFLSIFSHSFSEIDVFQKQNSCIEQYLVFWACPWWVSHLEVGSIVQIGEPVSNASWHSLYQLTYIITQSILNLECDGLAAAGEIIISTQNPRLEPIGLNEPFGSSISSSNLHLPMWNNPMWHLDISQIL